MSLTRALSTISGWEREMMSLCFVEDTCSLVLHKLYNMPRTPRPCLLRCDSIHAYGHFHNDAGVRSMKASATSVHHPARQRIVCVNSAICDNMYRALNPVTVVDISVPGPRGAS